MGMVNVTNLGFGGSGIPDSLPKAIAELQGMKMSIVAGAAANTLIVVPGMDPEDTIGSIVDLTTPASVDPATCTVQGRNASATITALVTAADGEFVTVNGRKYTVRDVVVNPSYNAPPGVVAVDVTPSGTDAVALAKALATAIMSGDSSLTCTVVGAVVTVLVRQPGTAGNSYTLSETGNSFTVSGANFAGGSAAASAGFKSTVSTAGKNLLVVWYDRHPGAATAPLLAREGRDAEEEDAPLGKLVFRHGKKEDEGRGDDDKRDEGRDEGRDEKPGPGKPKAGR